VTIASELPAFTVVGLLDKAVAEGGADRLARLDDLKQVSAVDFVRHLPIHVLEVEPGGAGGGKPRLGRRQQLGALEMVGGERRPTFGNLRGKRSLHQAIPSDKLGTRSMRRLKSDPVPNELIRKILEAGVCAPSVNVVPTPSARAANSTTAETPELDEL
jgi:hypothetical protein